ncbi:NADH-ubiquinone oxidoreductase complex I subunit, putative [Trypanosoma equiperdum]|uniref:NADH-ubiquinone oxidoreductase complex I subunit n=4 Tax=Trypanozoon TaxID=39700 RepID=Q383T6_TRYB2|nr:hypothetical protein, conserved [Trypanosoma brucei gambiense DAL972]XP_829057.1 hypothetical protein, conserved [Trypanosoma brucei brucei TREU927]RHW67518.1 NADH-ubiquinone oxidoreductase complex I subunit [Trypanosoma brucei equiperdum]SCU72741.1 NADH-ubiquinone oxidoreductase complex I subunit, putative [Trypanosoma equiperdum]EAN79945.1 hypothetical protein, conserved [Trypanosoma brucei brucei TREU927]CBH17996.1 hypothetical protein, conserved [Trypanosoma brucei gambiense DAL972]|eukprot:XP_011780260.1 hypothetical protein, conserved [Trypanosoma brucei gambiense DAL972]
MTVARDHDIDDHDTSFTSFGGERPPFERIPVPSMASKEYTENLPAFDSDRPMPPPRSVFERFSRVMQLQFGQDPDMPLLGSRAERKYRSWLDYVTSPPSPLLPRNYVDAYTRPNPCPEEYWWASWRWPRIKYVNAKVPPPVDGKYNDYYHYLAYKNWMERERDVYVAHANLVNEMAMRCLVKEGQYNAAKNCRHLYHKGFAMSRMEELNQTLLYMALTGNAAIRETPYPENFVEEKRKIYDDWLFRTRMKKPGDVA